MKNLANLDISSLKQARSFEDQLDLFVHQKPKPKVLLFEPIKWKNDEVEKLRLNILEHSLKSLVIGRKGAKHCNKKEEIMEWLMSNEDHPFSFNVCCNSAGLYPHLVREAVLNQIT